MLTLVIYLPTVIVTLTEKKCTYADKSNPVNMKVDGIKENIFLLQTADCLLYLFTWLKPHTVEYFPPHQLMGVDNKALWC